MNHKGEVSTDWGDGTHTFRLTYPGLIELEEKCGAPIADIIERVNGGRYSVTDIRETIRLALIGGGKGPTEALKLVRTYVDERIGITGLTEHLMVVRLILLGVAFGFMESPLGGKALAEGLDRVANELTLLRSTQPPPQSASH